MRRTEKNGTVDSVRRTYKLCCYRNTPNRSHAIFAWHESTLDVHPKNSFMVSNLTTGNSGQLKMSPKIPSVAKRRFWIWPIYSFCKIIFLSLNKPRFRIYNASKDVIGAFHNVLLMKTPISLSNALLSKATR